MNVYPIIYRVYTSQVVQDFSHQQYDSQQKLLDQKNLKCRCACVELGGENFTPSSWMIFFKLLGLKCLECLRFSSNNTETPPQKNKGRKPTSNFSPVIWKRTVKAPSHTIIKGQSAKPSTRWKLARTASIILSRFIRWSIPWMVLYQHDDGWHIFPTS